MSAKDIPMHKDSPILYRSLLRNRKVEFTSESAWLISSVLALPLTSDPERESIAKTFLTILDGHDVLKNIKRVSLDFRAGLSNRLVCLSSANRSLIPNNLESGYSCFTASNGSLFELKPGFVRYFADASQVLERYKQQNLPPQRSISRVADMNIGAGVCSGVFDGSRLVGFIFLNGDLTAEDLERPNIASLLTLIFDCATHFYRTYRLGNLYYLLANLNPEAFIGRRLEAVTLSHCVRTTAAHLGTQNLDVQVTLPHHKNDFLISHGNIGQIIGRTLQKFGEEKKANIEIAEDDTRLLFNVKTSASDRSPVKAHDRLRLAEVIHDARGLGLGIEFRNAGEFCVWTNRDIASTNPNVDYSVEYV